jgi:hypothetical protein
MKATTSSYVKYAAVAMLAAGSNIIKAEPVPCTISGQDGVVANYSGNPPPLVGDDLYTLSYDDANKQLAYSAPNQPGAQTGTSSVVGNQDTNVLRLPEFGLTFSKLNGNPGFNHGVFTNRWGTACGTLVDTGGGEQAENLVVQMGAYARRGAIPSLIIDFPITAESGYWPLRIPFEWTNYHYRGPLNFFTPVSDNKVLLSCGGLAVEVDGKTNAQAPGPCAINASIPTATFWGYAAMTLLLMFAGMRLLRKGGFGDDSISALDEQGFNTPFSRRHGPWSLVLRWPWAVPVLASYPRGNSFE